MTKLRFALVAALSLSVNCAVAQVKPADAARYRKEAFHVMLWNWMPMVNTVRGKTPYNQADFVKYAKRVAQIAPMLLEGFVEGSGGGNSEAKPEIWSNWNDFKAKMNTFERESAALARIAKVGDFAKSKVQFAKVGETCKACHELYKAE